MKIEMINGRVIEFVDYDEKEKFIGVSKSYMDLGTGKIIEVDIENLEDGRI